MICHDRLPLTAVCGLCHRLVLRPLLNGRLAECLEYFQDLVSAFTRSFDMSPTGRELEQSVVSRVVVALDRMRDTTLFEFTPQTECLVYRGIS